VLWHLTWFRALTALLACAVVVTACMGDARRVVAVEEVRPGEVTERVSAPARVEAAAREEVAAAVSGVVVGIEVEDGAQVQAGQVLVRLSSSQVDLAQQQAAAAQVAPINAITIDAGSGRTLHAVGEAVAALDANTKPALAHARAKAEQIADTEDRQAALATVESAEHAYEHSRAVLISSGRAIAAGQQALADSLSAALRQVLAQVLAPARAQAAAARAAAQAQQELLTVEAPFAGTVSLAQSGGGGGAGPGLPSDLSGLGGALPPRPAPSSGGPLRVGAQVTPGEPLFTVYDLSALYMTADVDEVDIAQIQVGQPVRVLVDAVEEGAFLGTVERVAIEATITEAGGTGYPVRIRIIGPAPDQASVPDLADLRLGMTGSVEISTRTQASDLVVASRALLRRGDEMVVFVVRDGVAREVPVEVEALGEDSAAVTGALRAGDEVVVEGYEDLRDGQRVNVQ
jgi:HlyD family secretion protein